MDVRWITAFVDRPANGFDRAVDFWLSVSGSTISPWRGEHDEFATLIPIDGGDAHLRVQRTSSARPGSHIDLHVADVRDGAEECANLGAQVLADHGTFVVLTSPGGMAFCVVPHHGERTRQEAVVMGTSGAATLVDQVSIDVDADVFDAETRFWSSVTGWSPRGARAPEFVPLDRPPSMPLRVMMQLRGQASGATTCHLDAACENVPAAVSEHESLGALVSGAHRYWTVMTDPAGVEYCLTSRQPGTGQLPPGESTPDGPGGATES